MKWHKLQLAVGLAVLAMLMALILGTAGTPSPGRRAEAARDQGSQTVEVKFREGTQVRLRGGTLTGLPAQDAAELASLRQTYSVVSIARLFSLPEEKLDQLKARGQRLSGKPLPDLNLWFRLILKPDADAAGFVQALKDL